VVFDESTPPGVDEEGAAVVGVDDFAVVGVAVPLAAVVVVVLPVPVAVVVVVLPVPLAVVVVAFDAEACLPPFFFDADGLDEPQAAAMRPAAATTATACSALAAGRCFLVDSVDVRIFVPPRFPYSPCAG
jgi:hypothetical protein